MKNFFIKSLSLFWSNGESFFNSLSVFAPITGRFQVKTDIAFLAFFAILDKDEDNSSLGYHCGVKFQDDKIRHVLNMRVSLNGAEIINKCAKMRVKNNQ